MKRLNQHSTKIFSELIEKLNDKEYPRLTAENYLPLTFEMVDKNIKTPFGNAKLYSLMHHFIQNGDTMRDPEMTFLVIDARQHPNDYLMLSVYPQAYQMESLGIFEQSIQIINNETSGYLFNYQTAHCAFANIWLKNINAQGFVK